MSKIIRADEETNIERPIVSNISARRSFLKWSGAAGLAAIAFGGKSPELHARDAFAPLVDPDDKKKSGMVDLGDGDIGILNYAYALEQLEAAFYTQVMSTPYAGMNSAERQILSDIRDHEIAHREFFKAALKSKAIPALQVNFTSINFNRRDSVLGTAKTFEDLGVSAYNGAGQLFKNPQFLLLAGKIVSIEARHAAAIRDLLQPLSASFSGDDVVDSSGLDAARMPSEVLAAAKPFIATPLTATKLPTPKA